MYTWNDSLLCRSTRARKALLRLMFKRKSGNEFTAGSARGRLNLRCQCYRFVHMDSFFEQWSNTRHKKVLIKIYFILDFCFTDLTEMRTDQCDAGCRKIKQKQNPWRDAAGLTWCSVVAVEQLKAESATLAALKPDRPNDGMTTVVTGSKHRQTKR